MGYSFQGLLSKSLKTSTEEENRVADLVMDMRKRGYDACELLRALQDLRKTLLQDNDIAVIDEAIEEIAGWCRQK